MKMLQVGVDFDCLGVLSQRRPRVKTVLPCHPRRAGGFPSRFPRVSWIGSNLNGHSTAFGKPHIIGGRALTVGNILVNSAAIVSRGTTCWLASAPGDGRTVPGSLDLVLKMAWRYSQRSNKADLLKRCQERGVKGIAVLYCYDDEQPETHGIISPGHF